MTSQTQLPAGLEPWADAFNALHPEFLFGLLPLLHGLDDLIHRRDAGQGDSGLLDGYAGISNRGTPERILISEWMLAAELPLEFLRRASENELMYLAPAYIRPQPRGRAVVLVDNGPDQLGAPRLAQLAALIVLHRRARARGAELRIGVLGEPADQWIEGDLAQLLASWLTQRSTAPVERAALDQRLEDVEAADEAWVLASDGLAADLKDQRRVLTIAEGAWGPTGVQELSINLDGDRMELALPAAEVAVRALRGSALRTAPDASRVDGLVDLRGPTFNSHARRLLLRGRGSREVVTAVVSEHAGRSPRIRRHSFSGTVLAGSALGKRLVVVVLEDGELRVRVIGKPLGRVTEFVHPVALLGVSAAEVEAETETRLPPVHFAGSDLIFGFKDAWWRLSQHSCEPVDAVAIAPGTNIDQPRMATVVGGAGSVGVRADWNLIPDTSASTVVVLGTDRSVAVSEDRVHWRTFIHRRPSDVIVVEQGCEVLALVVDEEQPKLVTLSPAGLIVRLVGAQGVRTLTRWSGGTGRPTIHPSLPMVAVQRADDLVEIGNLLTGELHQVIRSEA